MKDMEIKEVQPPTPEQERAIELELLHEMVGEMRSAINTACSIIELGDQRLLATDGPVGNQPPELSLAEWRKLYQVLYEARNL